MRYTLHYVHRICIDKRFDDWIPRWETIDFKTLREGASCEGCALLIAEENHCTDAEGRKFEDCSASARDDGKSVIFVQVGEAKD